jgi:pimeloyl-ACP methyl ester carboxylesterase
MSGGRKLISKKVIASIVIVLLVFGGVVGFEFYTRARVLEKFPPPGRLVDVGGRKLQIDCRGRGSPTVVLESGGDDIFGSVGWSGLHDDIASMTRACAYSRAGYMWSESRVEMLEAESGARDLFAALSLAGESPPFLPVGYSRGAYNSLIFADLFSQDVAALIFLEPRHPDLEERRAQAGIPQGGEPPLALATFGRALRWTGLPRLFGSYCKMPWYGKEIIDSCMAYFPQSLDGMISEDSVISSVRARAAEVRNLGDLPVTVLTRQLPKERLGSDEAVRAQVETSEDLWRQLHAEMASWSTHGKQRIVPNSTHQLPYTHPQIVLEVVNETIEIVRRQ